jgi:hypothetical protein
MSNKKALIFRGLILIAIAGFIISWLLKWWSSYVVYLKLDDAVVIHPWGLEYGNLGTFAGYLEGADMPAFFAPAMWTYLGLCIVALIVTLFIKNRVVSLGKFTLSLPSLLLFLVGVSYAIVVIVEVIFAVIRSGDFYGMKVIVTTYIYVQDHVESDMTANLQIGYWLACGTSIYCLFLAWIRNKLYK